MDCVSRSRACSRRLESLTAITIFHEGVGNTGPSSDNRKSPLRFAARSLRMSICSFWSASLQLAVRFSSSGSAMAMMSSAIALGSFDSTATATAAFGVTKSSDPIGAGAASQEATRCRVPENCRVKWLAGTPSASRCSAIRYCTPLSPVFSNSSLLSVANCHPRPASGEDRLPE